MTWEEYLLYVRHFIDEVVSLTSGACINYLATAYHLAFKQELVKSASNECIAKRQDQNIVI